MIRFLRDVGRIWSEGDEYDSVNIVNEYLATCNLGGL